MSATYNSLVPIAVSWLFGGYENEELRYGAYSTGIPYVKYGPASAWNGFIDIEVLAVDTRNTYLQTPTSEKYYIICGHEFGFENVGKWALIVWALYGDKVSGRDFWHHLRSYMDFLEFKSKGRDPDV